MKTIRYKIIEVYPEHHQIVVRYLTDDLDEDAIAADGNKTPDNKPVRCHTDRAITIFETPMPTGDALDELIMSKVPLAAIETLEKIANPGLDTSMSELLPMVGQEVEVVETAEKVAEREFLTTPALTRARVRS